MARARAVRVIKKPTAQEKKMRRIAQSTARKVVNKQIESKIWDGQFTHAGLTVDYVGNQYYVTGNPNAGTQMVQGTGVENYLGHEIRPTHLSVRFAVNNDGADATNLVTCLIYQGIGLFVPGATMANIFESTSNFSAPLSPLDQDYDNRFRVLYRKTFALTQASSDIKTYKVNIPYSKFQKVIFNDSIGTIESGPIVIGFITDSSADVDPSVRCSWRLHFKDA